MARAIGNEGLEFGVLLAVGTGAALIEDGADRVENLQVVALVMAADVVGFSAPARVVHEVDGLAVVEYVEPVADVRAVAVHRNILFFQALGDDDRDELLEMLLRAIVVGAVRGGHVHAVGMVIGTHDEVRTGLAGRVGAVGSVGRGFGKEAGLAQRAVHFVGGDMVEAAVFIAGLELARAVHPVAARRFDKRERTHVVGLHEGAGALDGVVHMALGREVDDAADVVLGEQALDELLVADIALHEGVVGHTFTLGYVGKVAGVGELIEVDDMIFRILFAEVRNKVRAYESGTAGNEYGFHMLSPALRLFVQFGYAALQAVHPMRDGKAEIAPYLGLTQHAVGWARSLGGVFVRFEGAHHAGQAALRHDGTGKVVPACYALVAVVVDFLHAGLDVGEYGHDSGGKVGGVGRRAYLVDNDAQRVALCTKATHSLDEVISIAREHPRRPNNHGSLGLGQHGFFASQLGRAIHGHRVHSVFFLIGKVSRAVENVVGGNLNDAPSVLRQQCRAKAVDAVGGFEVVFGLVHCGIGRAVDDNVKILCV